MKNAVMRFAGSEAGAVSMDSVVLSAALVALGLSVTSVVSVGLDDLSREIAMAMSESDPGQQPAPFELD